MWDYVGIVRTNKRCSARRNGLRIAGGNSGVLLGSSSRGFAGARQYRDRSGIDRKERAGPARKPRLNYNLDTIANPDLPSATPCCGKEPSGHGHPAVQFLLSETHERDARATTPAVRRTAHALLIALPSGQGIIQAPCENMAIENVMTRKGAFFLVGNGVHHARPDGVGQRYSDCASPRRRRASGIACVSVTVDANEKVLTKHINADSISELNGYSVPPSLRPKSGAIAFMKVPAASFGP